MSRNETPDPGWVTAILSASGIFTRLLQGILGVASIIGLVRSALDTNLWQVAISVAVFLLVAAWLLAGSLVRRRRPRKPVLQPEGRAASSYLRGLLPFEKHDQLLGRDPDALRLVTMVRSLEFLCGFVSGAAGAGKTSLLRAKLVPDLEKAGWCPVYLARTTGDPCAALCKALIALLPTRDEAAEATDAVGLIRRVSAARHEQIILLIFDQFEEYFITLRAPEARRSFEEMLTAVAEAAHQGVPVRILFSIRKEYVDDLLDVYKLLPELRDNRWRLPVRNFSSDTAREVLRKVAEDEGLQFSDELKELVIADLAMEGWVRPVEFQIVLTRLLEQGVYDVAAYRASKGAHGIIARFLAETIAPLDISVDELERRVAKVILRLLCNEEFTARRPVGLKQFDLLDRVLVQLHTDTQMSSTKAECERAVEAVLRRLVADYIVIREDEGRFNLAHDYLAAPVRDATAEIETVEELANRLLDQYVKQSRADRAVVLPWRTLRSVTRFATPDRLARSEAAALVRRSRQRLAGLAGLGALAVLILPTLLLPFGVRFPVVEQRTMSGVSILSANGRLLAKQEGSTLVILRLDTPRFAPREFGMPTRAAKLSPDGNSLLVLGTDGALYLGELTSDFRPQKLLEDLGWGEASNTWGGQPWGADVFARNDWGGFSPDGTWRFAVSANGWLYAWPGNNQPQRLLRLATFHDYNGRPVPVLNEGLDLNQSETSGGGVRGQWSPQNGPRPPQVGMTRDNRWLWVIDGEGGLFVLRPGTLPNVAPPAPRLSFASTDLYRIHNENRPIVATADSRWLVFRERGAVRAIPLSVTGEADPPRTLMDFGTSHASPNRISLAVSPDSQWVVARQLFGSFFAARLEDSQPPQTFPVVTIAPSNINGPVYDFVFDAVGRFTAGHASDGNIHLFSLESPPGTASLPIYREAPDRSTLRGRQAAFFCAPPAGALVAGSDGTIHHVAVQREIGLPRQVGRLLPGTLRFVASADNQTVLIHNDFQVAFAQCGDAPRVVLEHNSHIVGVSQDRQGYLVVVGETDLLRLDRRFNVWGIAVWRMPWPRIRIEN